MPYCHSAIRKMPLDKIPSKHRGLTENAFARGEMRERKALESRAEKAESVVEDVRRTLRDLLGAKGMATLREAMTTENKALRDLREPPGGLTLEFDKANQARKKKIESLIKEMGIDPERLRDVTGSFNEKLIEALEDPGSKVSPGYNLSHNLSQWLDLSPLHRYQLDWGVRPPVVPLDGWQVFGPEFTLWNRAFSRVESSGFVVTREDAIDEGLGFVAGALTMVCNDAGEFDFAEGIVDAEVVFIYEAPATGPLEVLVDATNAHGHNVLRLDNEFGFSEHWTNQRNYLSFNVYHPNVTERSLSEMSHFHREGAGDYEWSKPALTPGAHYYGHMVSNGTVAQGETCFVGVGTRSFDISRANDVGVVSQSDFGWHIRSVEIRVRA